MKRNLSDAQLFGRVTVKIQEWAKEQFENDKKLI